MRIDSAKYGGPCACGREHAMATRLCVVEEGALERLEDYLAEAGLGGLRRCAVCISGCAGRCFLSGSLPASSSCRSRARASRS